MAKVSLRIYNREIESLIDRGRHHEAIAHCHHILRTFPKHLATYRLLGKAYLEEKRYAEAVDVFSRILMAVPDDFVSHVGMSIIRDEENKLDDAIWHMERAFETQSSNAAIQGELQRLYGRRDGMEPPKIRMTRGALSHLYVQGELYPQAIAEIRAILAQEPERTDMQVLLARAYFRGGQKADASDMCAQLLKRYTYCFDANRIMVDLLPATAGVAESTQVYRMRVGEMDPYATFARGSVFLSNEVADAAISLEKIDYKEEESTPQSWTPALGLGSAAAAVPTLAASIPNGEPEWLKAGSPSEDSGQSAIFENSDEIPDFLRQAGWGTSTTPEQPTSLFDEEPITGGLTPAALPDWLKGQEPVAETPSSPEPAPAADMGMPDWLNEDSQTGSQSTDDIPDWLRTAPKAAVEPTPMDTTAAWLNELDNKEPAEAAPAENTPDWLDRLEEKQQTTEATPAENVPDWLRGLDEQQSTETAAAENVPDWLSGLDEKETAEPASTESIPDWLSGLGAQEQKPAQATADNLGTSAQEQDDAVAWLESLAAKHGAKPEELVTDPNKRSEKPPEWVAQAQNLGQEPPAPSVESLGATAEEQDDAVAWLESLAAKHGAKPEELVTDPNKRSEKPPEWVSQAQNLGQEPPAPSVESLGATAEEQDDAVAWLESLAAKHGAKPEELVTDPNKRSEKPPEWVAQAQSIGENEAAKPEQKSEVVEHALNIGEQFFAEFESASAAPPIDATSAWLKSLDEDEEKQDQSTTETSHEWFAEPEPLQRGEIPEWLSEANGRQEVGQEETQDEKSDLPGWLDGVEDDAAPQDASAATGESDLASWLNSLDDEPGLPFESMPSPDSILFAAQSKSSAKPQANEPVLKSELPDWLSAGTETSEEEQAGTVVETENLPDWLQADEETETAHGDDDIPPWKQRETWEVEGPQFPTPTSPSDWHPLEPQVDAKPKPAPRHEGAEAKAFVPPPPLPASAEQPVPAPALQPSPVAKKKKPVLPARKQPESGNTTVALHQAKSELDRGDIPAALAHYGKLIKKGKHIEETIRDLTESIYRYPVEVGIWQTLGDAYMRANRLKEALEAYNKAEELIR